MKKTSSKQTSLSRNNVLLPWYNLQTSLWTVWAKNRCQIKSSVVTQGIVFGRARWDYFNDLDKLIPLACTLSYASLFTVVILPLPGTNLSEWLNIQKREIPSSGPSFTNSWPSPLPHLPHRTCIHGKPQITSTSCIISCCLVPVTDRIVQKTQKKHKNFICASDLEGSESLHHLGDAVLSDGVSESRPGRRVGELWPTGEQRMVTLGAHIHTCKDSYLLKSWHCFISNLKNILI